MSRIPGTVTFALLLPVFAFAACASWHAVKEPDVSLTRVQAQQFGVFEQQLGLGLRIRNPNAFPLEVQGIRFGLEIEGEGVADGYDAGRFTVPAQGEHEVDVKARVQSVAMLRQVIAAGDDLSYEVRGKLLLGNSEADEVIFHHKTSDFD